MRMPKQTSAAHILLYSKDFIIGLFLRRSLFWRIDFLLLGLGFSDTFGQLVPILVSSMVPMPSLYICFNNDDLYWNKMHRFCICAKYNSRIVLAREDHDFPFNGNIFSVRMANSPLISQAPIAHREMVGSKYTGTQEDHGVWRSREGKIFMRPTKAQVSK
jgi:hypothetical protein